MLDIKFIRDNAKLVKKVIKDRGMEADVEGLLRLDDERRKFLSQVEGLKHDKNVASEEIGRLIKEGKDVKDKTAKMKTISQKIKDIDEKVGGIEQDLRKIALTIPNIPNSSVPVGPDPGANKIIREWGKIPRFDFEPRTHIEIVDSLGLVDFHQASKIAGTGFALFKAQGARLERALINFMLDLHTKKHNYIEISPPSIVNRGSMIGTGQLPKLEVDMYRLKDEDYFLIPTAEVPVTNIHRDEILREEDLPLRYTAYTPCFRREAGSYGKETKGLIRVHQFDKVELVKFTKPEDSWDELESLVRDAEEVLQLLELPYRVTLLSTQGVSFAASKCYDLEAWAPGAEKWLEVSSCSNFIDFQARRANIKYRPKEGGKVRYVHTLNGSGVALARTVVALLEVHQRPDGTIKLPEALRPYLDGQTELR